MNKEQIEQKAKNVYMRCFDDDFEYTGVLHALEICAEETATEATKELEAQIEKMEYALNKIIKTVHNDNISGYGDRLVTIYDISCEVLQEIKEK
jgi:hypothetical protein